jgi:hypothetical protein
MVKKNVVSQDHNTSSKDLSSINILDVMHLHEKGEALHEKIRIAREH